MLRDERHDAFDQLARGRDADQKALRELTSDGLVPGRDDARDAVAHFARRACGLAGVVQQYAEHPRDARDFVFRAPHRVVRERVHAVQRVRPDVAFRVPLGFLFDPDERGEFGEVLQPIALAQERESE